MLICFARLGFGLRVFILTCSFASLIRQNVFLVLRDSHGLIQVVIPQDEVIDLLLFSESLFDAVVE